MLAGPGDDAAVVRAGGALAVTSTDTTVLGVHLPDDDERATPALMGHRALATALSDLAAMGVPPGESYVAMTVPPAWTDDDVLAAVAAIEELSEATGNTIAGGDVTSGPVAVITVTVVGWAAAEDRLLRRTLAVPGQRVGVTGVLGGSRAGLALLRADPEAGELSGETRRDALTDRYLRPFPRLTSAMALLNVGVRVGIDLSDGVATDAGHVGRASGVVLSIDVDRLPRQAGVDQVAAALGIDPARMAATGGEDFELLFTADTSRVAAIDDVIEDVTWIGEVLPAADRAPGVVLHRNGAPVDWHGFEHRAD